MRHPNHRLVKTHRNYTVEEVASLFRVHRNTVREWVKRGLPTCDDRRPMLILGTDLAAFLRARRLKNRRTCPPGEIYCVRCRAPRAPAGSMAEYQAISEFPKWRKYLILLSFLDNSSARPVQIGGVDVNICHSRVDRSPRTPAVQFAIPPRGDHFVAHGRALWKLTGRGRTERAHRAVENAVRFPRASTGPFPSSHPRKTPKGP